MAERSAIEFGFGPHHENILGVKTFSGVPFADGSIYNIYIQNLLTMVAVGC